MRQKLIKILSILVVITLTATPVFAEDVHFNGPVFFVLGSLIASGELGGLGHRDVTVTLDAKGVPDVTCTNQVGKQVAGQHPQLVSATGSQVLDHNTFTHGNSPFHVETGQPRQLSAVQLGCRDNHWTATINFVFWTNAVITVQATHTHETLLHQAFNCTTTRTSVSCTPQEHAH